VAIIRRVARASVGNFGDHKFLQNGVSELRIDVGLGYRVYYAQVGDKVILLTHGGDKRTQTADIAKATNYWKTGGNEMQPDRSHEEASIEMFRDDPALAASYLNSVLEDGDEADLMLALRTMSKAFGGVQEIARQADVNAHTLYRTLSAKGNPELRTLSSILHAMGMRLAIQPIEHHSPA
jgi:putative addiction module killer protein/probable addiction module antidote protein